jgi:hypothetical protein
LKNVKIEDDIFVKIKKHCNENGLKIYSWIGQILSKELQYLEKLNENKNNSNIPNKK